MQREVVGKRIVTNKNKHRVISPELAKYLLTERGQMQIEILFRS